LIILIQSLYFW